MIVELKTGAADKFTSRNSSLPSSREISPYCGKRKSWKIMELTLCQQLKLLSVRFLIKLSKGTDFNHDYVRLPLSQWDVHNFAMTFVITLSNIFLNRWPTYRNNTLFVFTFITEILDACMIYQANLGSECLESYKSVLKISEENILATSFQSWGSEQKNDLSLAMAERVLYYFGKTYVVFQTSPKVDSFIFKSGHFQDRYTITSGVCNRPASLSWMVDSLRSAIYSHD